jgi:cation:H+ antiporter
VPALSLGNVIGANIMDLTLVMGIIVLLERGINVKTKQTRKDSFWAIGILAVPLVLFLVEGYISRIGGAILVGFFILYSWRLIKAREKHRKVLEDFTVKRKKIVIESFLFVVLLILLFFASQSVVYYASLLSIDLGLPPILIGMFILAIGTVCQSSHLAALLPLRG